MKNLICRVGIIILSLPLQTTYASEPQTFTVGVQDIREYLPYSEYKNGEYKGFNRKILDLFAKSKKYTFIYKARPVKRLYKEYLAGEFDLKYPDNPYWSSDLKEGVNIKYSSPVVEYIDGVLVRSENKEKGIGQLKKLGVVDGFTPFSYLKPIEAGTIKISKNADYDGLLKQTILKRIDGAYSNIAVSQYYLEKILNDKNALVFDSNLPHTKSHRHLSSSKHPKIIEEFNDFLEKNNDVVEELKKKHRVEEGIKSNENG